MSCCDEERTDYYTRRDRTSRRGVEIVKGHGTVASTGVLPTGTTTPPVVTEEVEFKIKITKDNNEYKGSVYIVDYDSRIQINSNKLVCCRAIDDVRFTALFEVNSSGDDEEDGGCYELTVAGRGNFCGTETPAKFYAYAPALCNSPGLNLGGILTKGEIQIQCCGIRC